MPIYNHVGPFDASRRVRIVVEAESAGESDANLFEDIRYATTVTNNQKLAQTRLDYVVQALGRLAVVDSVRFVDDSHGTAAGTNNGPAIEVEFVTETFGTLVDANDIVDTIGKGTAAAKTKDGLQSVVDALATLSFDGGTTGPFGALSASGNITNEDGTVTAGAPTLAAGANPSGLSVRWIG